MSTAVQHSRFAAQPHALSAWPNVSSLSVPAGIVSVQGQGLLIHSDRVVGVCLSPKLCILTRPRMGTTDDLVLLEQAAGFLHAHDVVVPRLRLRCPVRWLRRARRMPQRWCVVYWVRSYLAEGYARCRLRLPPYIIVPGAFRMALKAGADFWHDVALIVHSLIEYDPQALNSVATTLFPLARWWEVEMLKLRWRAEGADKLTPEDLDLFSACDRRWASCMRSFPAYQPKAETTSRLL